ncbi:MAG: riboflavin biosynthesis protein ribd [Frankiales bacterium]|nr:riboflavin biosynthesis protein ribd [Frankiales bacterium]
MDDAQALRRAVALSATVLGTTSPNPPVGAVVLDAAGEVVGEGATQPPEGPHAEVVALRAAGERARGGTAVVTLEPCRHTGRTGPCTTALLDAGVARVVVGAPDPTAQAGGGAELLREAGLEVEVVGLPVGTPLEGWLTAQRTGRPFVTWKYAATLDGRSAAADGTSRWITGETARADVHRLRGEVDAVVVGVGTVLADDPQLTVRPDSLLQDGRQPLRVVVDSQRRAPRTARVFDGEAPTVHAVVGRRDDDALALPPGPDGRVDLVALLAALTARGVVSVLLEGGPTLAAAFLRAGLVDRVVGYVAPALLGAGPQAVADLGAGTISAALRLRLDEVVQVGDDVRLTVRPMHDPSLKGA